MRGKPWKVLMDIDSYKYWLADRVTDDWPVLLLVKLTYCDEYDREWAEKGKYHLAIEAVAPDAPEAEHIDSVLTSISSNLTEWNNWSDEVRAVNLSEYGTKATLWQEQGNNLRKLIKAARSELTTIGFLFGFYMDKAQNAIGNTGWDWIKGEIGFKRAASPAAE